MYGVGVRRRRGERRGGGGGGGGRRRGRRRTKPHLDILPQLPHVGVIFKDGLQVRATSTNLVF